MAPSELIEPKGGSLSAFDDELVATACVGVLDELSYVLTIHLVDVLRLLVVDFSISSLNHFIMFLLASFSITDEEDKRRALCYDRCRWSVIANYAFT